MKHTIKYAPAPGQTKGPRIIYRTIGITAPEWATPANTTTGDALDPMAVTLEEAAHASLDRCIEQMNIQIGEAGYKVEDLTFEYATFLRGPGKKGL